jgi:alanine racemase
VKLGDRAILFGDPADGLPSADEWAEASGTINYEIVTRIGPRVTRVVAL